MKRLFLKTLPALVLAAGVLTMSACGGALADVTEDPAVSQTQVTEAVQDAAFEFTPELEEKLDEVLRQNNFTGVVQLTHHGEPVYTSASGTNDLGQPRTMEDAMYLGSISKQFCAVAILILRDEGKLNLDDTLDKYFPEYSLGKDITIQNLLTMRSGIVRDCDIMGQDPLFYFSQTKEENIASFKEWVFAQPLQFTPGTELFYSNVNYTLLSLIVEAVSGQEYDDFIRQRILEPVGMEHTGFIRQIKDAPQWAEGLTYDRLEMPGVTDSREHAQLYIMQGCGNLVSTAGDMDLWMRALRTGQVICEESFREMIADYGPGKSFVGYGYGVMPGVRGGVQHGGNVGAFASMMYFNEEYGFQLYMNSSEATAYRLDITQKAGTAFLRTLFQAVDAT